jgi:carboxymethylenebutenolidase
MTSITFGASKIPGLLFGSSFSSTAQFGLIAIQEWWGINEEIKGHAQAFSDHLKVPVLVPDLYRGKVALEVAEANHLMSELDWGRAVGDITAAADHLKTLGAKKVGVFGFCMGGALSLLATKVPTISASVPFYGIPPNFDCAGIKVPVQGHFGELDGHKGFSDQDAVEELTGKLERAWVPHEIYSYPGVGHAFMNKQEGWYADQAKKMSLPEYNPEAAKLAFERATTFFQTHLTQH